MELVDTITHKNLPNEFHMTYDTKGMFTSRKIISSKLRMVILNGQVKPNLFRTIS